MAFEVATVRARERVGHAVLAQLGEVGVGHRLRQHGAALAAFLSPEAGFITGAALTADGGYLA
ncbi:hypothetical protein MPEAHAMD_4908 [Methylobacterium frigidaeris]|uniref:Uncharacterized protein n=1 Tax=Methylobacterium frigidaeris TaxID=2038277 RepID=A0AA37HFB1_9HYPH|nr:hypothetical protein MPEAHAMD_4908 [Methylobacterium frigidaeris]